MKRICSSLAILLALGASTFALQPATPRPLNVIVFGAHPDDAELSSGGTASLWAADGHNVKLVAMTNGDIGHFSEAGGPLAQRRYKEVQECARIFGVTTDVLDIHDGELVPSLENRRTVARLIRTHQADIVISHRPYDYHPDHRYTGVLVNDAAVIVAAPFFVPDTPPTRGNPIFLYSSDEFDDPTPFQPHIVVDIDAVADKKWDCIKAMPSQFADRDSWAGRYGSDVPEDAGARQAHILAMAQEWSAGVTTQHRARLVELYGEARGNKVRYAEAFQLNQYGRQVPVDDLKRMFPTF
jgi:N-acetylglucosamine malate deacetylase 1